MNFSDSFFNRVEKKTNVNEVSKEKENKIIEAVVNDNVPKDIDKLI